MKGGCIQSSSRNTGQYGHYKNCQQTDDTDTAHGSFLPSHIIGKFKRYNHYIISKKKCKESITCRLQPRYTTDIRMDTEKYPDRDKTVAALSIRQTNLFVSGRLVYTSAFRISQSKTCSIKIKAHDNDITAVVHHCQLIRRLVPVKV